MTDLRVRLAPSPTGPLHVGNAYIGLFNLALARSQGGQFVLRIEDTDQTRSSPEYERQLLESLRWLGLVWDEGPDVGGPHAPYRQSERLQLYQRYARELVDLGHAYHCFCTSERLEALRGEQARNKLRLGYDGHCRSLSEADVDRLSQEGRPGVVRLKVPDSGSCVVRDTLRGEISFDYGVVDDQVLLKSDGFPTYHLAVVVDDHLMEINHIVRGEEWINSAPKHLLLYEAFGWDPPKQTHLPLLLNPDGSKLSKRRNPTSVEYYRKAGYLAPALCNYLALMAYPPLTKVGEGPEEGEKFTFEQLSGQFDISRVNLGGSIFDVEKLDWLNSRFLREDMSPDLLLKEMKGWLLNDDYLSQMIPLMQPRMETLGDFMGKCWFFFARRVDYPPEDLIPKKRQAEEVVQVLQTVLWALEAALPLDAESVEAAIRRVGEFWEWPVRDVTAPLFVAVMGQKIGPPLFESVTLLGLDLARDRLLRAMEALGGLSKKRTAKLEKAWASI